MSATVKGAESRGAAVARLRRSRSRSWLLRGATWGFVALAAWAWLGGTIEAGGLFTQARAENLARFVTVDVVPTEVRNAEIPSGASDWEALTTRAGVLLEWIGARFRGRNLAAALATVNVAIVASVLAALLALLLAPFTARTLLGAKGPFDPDSAPNLPGRAARLACVVMRSVPEYVLAFLLGASLPDPAWACVIALVIHNGGILGRLFGETLENLDQRPARAWYDAGAPRLTIYAGAQLPVAMPRMLTYFFTRFESCVRESTVLGMLGFVSLGHWIVQERAAGHYDEMLMLIVFGSLIVIVADFVSWIARTIVRRAA